MTTDISELRGIIGAALTPFDDSGAVDYGALEREIDYLVDDCHVDAISIAAVEVAEYTVLSPEARRELLRAGAELVRRRVPLILGASDPLPRNVAVLAELAAAVGADLVQVLIPRRPWGPEAAEGELISYFDEVAERSPLPIVAYHNPGPGSDPSIATMVKLSQIPKVDFFKESSRDISKIGRLIREIDLSGNARYFTTMQPLLATLLLGGSGATIPPPGTKIGGEVMRAFRAGKTDEAAMWQRMFSVFPAKWASYGLVPVMKAAMKHLGCDLGAPMPPYQAVSPADDMAIGDFLIECGLKTR